MKKTINSFLSVLVCVAISGTPVLIPAQVSAQIPSIVIPADTENLSAAEQQELKEYLIFVIQMLIAMLSEQRKTSSDYPSCTLIASKTSVKEDENFTLKWSSVNATSISGLPMVAGELSGSATTSIPEAGTYQLSLQVSGEKGKNHCTVDITVK